MPRQREEARTVGSCNLKPRVAQVAGAMIAGLIARLLYEPNALVETVVVEERRA